MKDLARFSTLAVAAVALAACGGGGSSSTDTTSAPPPAAAINVALSANGAAVSATFGGATANFVNDGDSTTTANFWAGNVADDAVTIDFGQLRSVSEVTVYTSNTSFNSSSPAKYIEISADGTAWKKTAQLTGADVGCIAFSSGSGKIRCVFSAAQAVRYFRVRVTAVSPGAQQIVEMEAQGS